jgi:Tfp pilus assembly protein PilF
MSNFRPYRRLPPAWPRLRPVWYALILSSILGAAAAVASDLASLTPPPAPFRAPYVPAAGDEILQEVPATADPAVVQMRKLRAAFDAAPQSLAAGKQLADAYIDYSRQIGDAHYAGYAEAVIVPWLHSPHPPAAALVTQAVILQYRHSFDEARGLLQRALQADHSNGQAWLTLATLDMVQGDYDSAAKGCGQVSQRASIEVGLACYASLRSYTGRARESLRALQQLEGGSHSEPLSYQAWVQGLLAESAERLGDWGLAELHYRKALDLLPRDNFLLVAYADFLLDRARPREVLPLLADHTQSDTAFLRLALAQSALHGSETQRYGWIMAARFEALRLRGSDYFGREESRFALQLQHDSKAALEMALRNWQRQRAPWDARVVLEAALAANRPEAAAPVLQFLEKTKLEDPILEPMVKALRLQMSASGVRK